MRRECHFWGTSRPLSCVSFPSRRSYQGFIPALSYSFTVTELLCVAAIQLDCRSFHSTIETSLSQNPVPPYSAPFLITTFRSFSFLLPSSSFARIIMLALTLLTLIASAVAQNGKPFVFFSSPLDRFFVPVVRWMASRHGLLHRFLAVDCIRRL